jgi:site-specific recombinase XerD
MEKDFEQHLRKSNLSENTITSYLWTVNYYTAHYESITKANLLSYKGYLIEHYKPQTVNLRLMAINTYLLFLGKEKLQLKFIKVQQKNFLENVISDADYQFFKEQLKNDDNLEWYFVVWYLTATGARVSELVQIKVEHVKAGFFDLYTKGGKLRRLYIPKLLKDETEQWLTQKGILTGYIFLNRYGERITTRGIAQQMKTYAANYGLDIKVVYPHSFRHRFAKNFLEKYNDIALLTDLMGHESIETTRIYLRRTASEQKEIADKIVTW